MSFGWTNYINLAEELLNKSEESYLRSSISRAYYGIFGVARNYKGYQNYKAKAGESIHWAVINAYRTSSNTTEQNIGIILDKLRKSRNEADYNEDKVIDQRLAQEVILRAKTALTLMGR